MAIPASGDCQVAGLHAADGSSRREDVPIVPHDPVDAMSGKLPVILMSLLGVAVLAMVGVGFWLSRPEPRETKVLTLDLAISLDHLIEVPADGAVGRHLD